MSEPRTLEEVKNDIRSRVGHRAPFLHADKTEAEEALAHMPTLEGETWAAAWNELGARWEARASAAEKAGNAAQAKEAFLKSYGYYGVVRHPFPSTPGKNHGYRKTREMFLAAAKYFDIPVERVSIPFQGKAIVGHLRFPKELPGPMIMHWGALDNLLKRPEVNSSKIAVVGASFGGHWSTKLAHAAPDKLRGAVNWGGGIHYFFQPIEARANLFGKKTFDELCAVMPALSLLSQGWLEKPCAPMLIVNGKEDKQVPLEDFYLLLEHGKPKTIRLFPGGHMGSIPNIFKTVITWLHEKLDNSL